MGSDLPFPGAFPDLEFPEPDGSGRTVMEMLGKPNAATRALKEIQAEIGDRVFATKAEAEAFFHASILRRRQAPIDDFLGLSSETMHAILHGGAEAMEPLLRLRGGIREEDLAALPMLEETLALLGYLAETGPVKATAKGNLPRSLVQRWWDEVFAPRVSEARLLEILRPNREEGDWSLLTTRKIARKASLIKLHSGKFSLTENGKSLLERRDLDGIYRLLFVAGAWSFDWNEGRDDFRYLHPLSQDGFLFNLYLFRKLAVDWIDGKTLVDAWLRAFPAVLSELGIENGTDCSPFLKATFEYGLVWMPLRLGLLEERRGLRNPQDNLAPAEYRLSPVASRLLEWRL